MAESLGDLAVLEHVQASLPRSAFGASSSDALSFD